MNPIRGYLYGFYGVVSGYLLCGYDVSPRADYAFVCYVLAVMVGINGALLNL